MCAVSSNKRLIPSERGEQKLTEYEGKTAHDSNSYQMGLAHNSWMPDQLGHMYILYCGCVVL